MRYNKILITLVLLLLAGVAIGPFIIYNNAVTSYQSVWNKTSDWNSGTKTSVDSSSTSCLASGQGLQLNSSSGFYGVTDRCPTGSNYISSNSIDVSYDMSTVVQNQIKDFSGNQNWLWLNGVNSTSGKFGNAMWFGGGTQYLGLSTSNLGNFKILLANFTLAAWINVNSGQGGSTSQYGTIFGFINDQAFSNRFLLRCSDGTFLFQYGAGATTITWSNYVNPCNTWHAVVLIKTFSDVSLYIDGALFSTQAASGFLSCGSTCNQYSSGSLFIGYDGTGSSSDHLKGKVDDVVISNRTWTTNEITAFSSVGSYSISGSWKSPSILTNNEIPIGATFGFNNVSSNSKILDFKIYNNTNIVYTSPTAFTSGTNNISLFTLSLTPYGNATWYILVDFQGIGTLTPQLNYVALVFEVLPAVQSKQSFAPTFDTTAIAIILLIFAFSFLFATGFIERFLMVGAAIVAFIIGVLSWSWTGEPFVPAIFVLVGTACIGLAMVIKPR